MRCPSLRLRACTAVALAAMVCAGGISAQQPEVPRPEAPRADNGIPAELKTILNPRPPADLTDAELAGLPKGSRMEVVTWERAYTLALAARREGAERQGDADFARFRREFFAGVGKAEGTFRDPSGLYFELLRRIQAIEGARVDVSSHMALLTELSKLEADPTRLNNAGLNRIEIELQQARRKQSEDLLRYRDQLDAFKVELGLPPGAPVAIDQGSLGAFRAVFDQIDRWSADPNRSFEDLPRLADRLPATGDVVIDGRSFLGGVDDGPDPMEPLLSLGARVALKNRAARGEAPGPEGADASLELRVRRRIRHLLETRRAYEEERRRLVLAIGQKDSAFERLLAPPLAPAEDTDPGRSGEFKDVIDRQAQVFEVQGRLVDLWTTFRAERLALYRDLGAMPFADWKSFYAQFTATPGQPAPAKSAPRVRPASPVPAPPEPPAPLTPGA